MRFPCGLSEATVLAAIDQALSNLAKIYRFGYHELKDMEQEGRLLALEVLKTGRYDCKKPLAPFLFAHIRNRLSNMKRNKFRRNDPPCQACHFAFNHDVSSECNGADGGLCKKYEAWRIRNAAKQNLMNMLDLSLIDADSDYLAYDESHIESDLEEREHREGIDQLLPTHLRKIYLRARAGEKISKADRGALEQFTNEQRQD